MVYFLLSFLLSVEKDGINQIERNKYKIDNFSEFSPALIQQRGVDSVLISYVSGNDSILSEIYTFDNDGYNIKKSNYLPDGKAVANQFTYKWKNRILEYQTFVTFHKGKVQKLDRYNYEYSFPKITTKAISENGKIISVQIREYDVVDSTLSKEINYSVEKGKHQLLTTANYSYSADGNIIVRYYDENKKLSLTTIMEKSKYVNSISVFGILPDGGIDYMKILFYDKDNNLIKTIANRNSTSSTTVHVYKDGLLHQVIYPTHRYVYKYYFKGK